MSKIASNIRFLSFRRACRHPLTPRDISRRKANMNCNTAGPSMTTKSAGNRQNTNGNTSLTPTFAALSSAACRRFVRISLGHGPQRLRDARPEPVGLNQHRHQRADVLHLRALREVLERLEPGLSGARLSRDHAQLLGKSRVRDGQFLGGLDDGLVQAAAGLEAHDEQVEHVRQAVANLPSAARRSCSRGRGRAGGSRRRRQAPPASSRWRS